MNIYDIAKIAGVSPATVSRVINENPKVGDDKRRRVLDALRQCNYTPNELARNLAGQASKTVAILCVDIRHINYSTIAYEIERKASGMGYNVFLCNTTLNPDLQRRSLHMMAAKRVDCLILIGSSLSNDLVHGELDATFAATPVILLNNQYEGEQAYGIFGRIADGVVQSLNYLHSLGHRKIAFIKDGDTWVSRLKEETFRNRMKKLNLPVGKHTVFPTYSGFDSGVDAVNYFEGQGAEYTAIMGCDDITALGIVRELKSKGRSVPDDVSVIGYFNTLYSRVSEPSLTTVDNNTARMTQAITSILHNALTKTSAPGKTYIEPQLIVRESTGPVASKRGSGLRRASGKR